MTHHSLVTELKNEIAILTLNRPEARNALNEELINNLSIQIQKLNHDSSIKVLVLKGSGTDFCAGADLNWMKKSIHYSHEENLADATKLAELFYALYQFSKPVIVVVEGRVFGGGLGLIACADIAIASPNAQFCFSEVKLGLASSTICPYVLNAIGERNARRYMITAEIINCMTAKEIGLIHEIVESEKMDERILELITKLKQNAPKAMKITKDMITQIAHETNTPFSLIEYTSEVIANIRKSPEAQEGMNAFLQKRIPSWPKED